MIYLAISSTTTTNTTTRTTATRATILFLITNFKNTIEQDPLFKIYPDSHEVQVA